MPRWFDLNEDPLERTKTRFLLFMLALAGSGEIGLVLIDLSTGANSVNNLLILGCLAAALAALARGHKTTAVYLSLLPFGIDFLRAFYTGGGVGTHALPLFFLQIVLAIYLLPTRHSLFYVGLLLVGINIDIPLRLSAQLAIPEAVEAAANPGRRFVVVNAIAIGITAIFATAFHSLNKYFGLLQYQNAHLDELVRTRTAELERERERSEQLLLNILPEEMAGRLKRNEPDLVDAYDDATVLFADIVGFTAMSKTVPANRLVEILNDTFSAIDELVEAHGLEKIKTIGDAYMVAAGIPQPMPDHVRRMADFALDLVALVDRINRRDGLGLDLRVGFNRGPVIAGVIGKKKFMYDLWGETVNVASRLESTGVAGRIQVTGEVRDALADGYAFTPRGDIDVKGVGRLRTCFLAGRRPDAPEPPAT